MGGWAELILNPLVHSLAFWGDKWEVTAIIELGGDVKDEGSVVFCHVS